MTNKNIDLIFLAILVLMYLVIDWRVALGMSLGYLLGAIKRFIMSITFYCAVMEEARKQKEDQNGKNNNP